MKCMIIGGFLGSGKTTTIRKLVEHLGKQGQKTAIIVNEIGEIGIDGDTISQGGIETREITSGCVCCTLRISMEHTLKSLMAEYSPDTIIIEPTGIAFPRQIKNNIESMALPGLSFAPVVNLVDANRLSTDPEELQNFMRNQIEEADILGINKVDLIKQERLLEICIFLRKLNPKARMFHFSARTGGETLGTLLEMLGESSRKQDVSASRNSVDMSGVSAYSSEFEITSPEIPLETAVSVSGQILEDIRNRARELNPEFIGHIKLSFTHGVTLVKGSITAAHENPELEVLKKEGNPRSRIKVLSAVTAVPREELARAVDAAVCGGLGNRQISFKKQEHKTHRGHSPVSIGPFKPAGL
ncbi:GTP-binding protein [Methanosarcina sp. KYL-1]|uniref:CobW family GTP-binding protein n=1 Tax=Methanosarcina sp. KYL-1 TaxID=2602068 RepID=UPI0021006CE0|nr:GTP-binding protein [Methanosarcina sp. KYL-1]MCQ1535156.1 GTP-binding protein [Methanosarcina sp. KYL-1]